ncbi:MAG: ribosome biogenesis GTPase Der [Gammaproteobacteria bacterium]|nr:ribosome biogenesis GTPase Der [Gammaproteobacteria bacterium]
MLPVIAIVGRPNVGKSTLFNCITRTKAALVADFPGVTRDRQYGKALYQHKPFMVVDTCGLGESDEDIDVLASQQAQLALTEADVIFFVVDGRAGLTPVDIDIANELRKLTKPLYLLVNKSESQQQSIVSSEFQALGFKNVHCVSAAHQRGIADILDEVTAEWPMESERPDFIFNSDSKLPIKVAVIGRPNVGKSTFINRLVGEERVVVYDMPGTTRDTIEIPVELYGQPYIFMDTAGIRRRARVSEKIEKFSVIKTLQAVDASDVCLILINGQEPITDQDMHLIDYVVQAGKALVIAFNKCDVLTDDDKKFIKQKIELRMPFQDYYQIRFISALKGFGMRQLWTDIQEAYKASSASHATSFLTKILQQAVDSHQPPLVNGRRVKMRFAHMGGVQPPIVVIHGNQVEALPDSYRRFLKNYFLDALNLTGTPLELIFKSGENPFAGKKNKLTQRQMDKRKRLKKFIKKKYKK